MWCDIMILRIGLTLKCVWYSADLTMKSFKLERLTNFKTKLINITTTHEEILIFVFYCNNKRIEYILKIKCCFL